jgi:hypothetical protein
MRPSFLTTSGIIAHGHRLVNNENEKTAIHFEIFRKPFRARKKPGRTRLSERFSPCRACTRLAGEGLPQRRFSASNGFIRV